MCYLLIGLCFYPHCGQSISLNCDVSRQCCTRCPLCISWGRRGKSDKAAESSVEGTFKTDRASLIYPQTSLSLTLSPARDHDTITQDQMGVMSSLRTNGPWLTASFIVLNGVSVVHNDSVTACINVAVVFEDCTLYHSCNLAYVCLSTTKYRDTRDILNQPTTWIKGLKEVGRFIQKLCWN